MTSRGDLARAAVSEALRLRARRSRPLHAPICPIDLAIEEGIDVRLQPIATLEGMYSPDGPTVIIGSLRPRGRRSFTCAHELGHHVFGHGLRVDDLLDETADPDDDTEYVANRFAAALLMPRLAVLNAFAVRGWTVSNPSAEQVYVVAGLLGVGYTTLIAYLRGTLNELAPRVADALEKVKPKAIRAQLAGVEAPGVIVVDHHWTSRPVDAEVGDIVIVPAGAAVSETMALRVRDGAYLLRAPGTATISSGPWHANLRVSRSGFYGIAAYRFFEECDNDD